MPYKIKILRITTVPESLKILLKGQLKYMNEHFEVVGVSSPGKELDNVSIEEGIRTVNLEMTRKISPIQDFISLLKMIILIVKEKPCMVHTHTPKAGIIGMAAAWICRVPVRIHTVAGLPLMETKGLKKAVLKIVEKITYFFASKVYPNSFGLYDYIVKQNLTAEQKLKVIGFGSSNGIDTDHFNKSLNYENIRSFYNLDQNFIFLYVGRLVKDKGINELVLAFDRLNISFENISLIMVGDREDELNPISAETSQIIKANKNILEVGFKDDVRPHLNSCDVFILPTYREGFPNVLLQACSMEVPSITTNISGCNEIIRNNHNGILIEPKDADALYMAMKEIIKNKDLVNLLGKNARQSVVLKFDRTSFHQYILEEYKSLLIDI